jgi:hypothetical protein
MLKQWVQFHILCACFRKNTTFGAAYVKKSKFRAKITRFSRHYLSFTDEKNASGTIRTHIEHRDEFCFLTF